MGRQTVPHLYEVYGPEGDTNNKVVILGEIRSEVS